MPDRPKRVSDLIQEVLDEQAQAINFSPEEIEAGAAQLHRMFREIRERAGVPQPTAQRAATAPQSVENALPPGDRRLRYEAVLRPGTYRLRLGGLTFRVILGEARRTSRILIDAARDLLIPDPDAWGVVARPALATRSGAEDPSRVDIAQPAGSASGTVIADDTDEEPRVLVLIRGFPADQPLPVLELGEEEDAEGTRIVRLDPEVSPERNPDRR